MQSFAKRIRVYRGYGFFVAIPQALLSVAKELGCYEDAELHAVCFAVGKAQDIKTKYNFTFDKVKNFQYI